MRTYNRATKLIVDIDHLKFLIEKVFQKKVKEIEYTDRVLWRIFLNKYSFKGHNPNQTFVIHETGTVLDEALVRKMIEVIYYRKIKAIEAGLIYGKIFFTA